MDYDDRGYSQWSHLDEGGEDEHDPNGNGAHGNGHANIAANAPVVAPYRPQVSQEQLIYSFKVMADPVHERIAVPEVVRLVLDTREFQRLRDLKQLGTCYMVFPGANHNRFEHSLGGSWIVEHSVGEIDGSSVCRLERCAVPPDRYPSHKTTHDILNEAMMCWREFRLPLRFYTMMTLVSKRRVLPSTCRATTCRRRELAERREPGAHAQGV